MQIAERGLIARAAPGRSKDRLPAPLQSGSRQPKTASGCPDTIGRSKAVHAVQLRCGAHVSVDIRVTAHKALIFQALKRAKVPMRGYGVAGVAARGALPSAKRSEMKPHDQ
jgi:hypothetical protein